MSELLFFKPPNSASRFTRSGSIYPPLGLCQLAAMFPCEQVEILDAEAEDLDTESAKGRIAHINPRVALLTASSFTLPLIEEWAKWFKDQKIQVVVGGCQSASKIDPPSASKSDPPQRLVLVFSFGF